MTDLPEGWTEVRLDDIALSVKNGIFVSRPGVEPDGLPILRISAVRPGRLRVEDVRYTGKSAADLGESDSLLHPGDLLFTRYNGNINLVGACAIVPQGVGPLTYPDKLIRVRVDPEAANSAYIAYLFQSPQLRSRVRALARTTAGQAGISGASLRSVGIPLPPLAEQRRIVAALEETLARLDRGLAGLALAAGRARKLDQRLCGRVVGGWPLSSASEEYNLPDGWSIANLGSLSFESGYGTSTKCAYDAAGVPVLRIPNVQNGEVSLADMKYAVDESQNLDSYFVTPGDLLFVRTNGSPQLIGRVAVVREAMKVAFASYLIRFRLKPGTVDPDWVALVVSSPAWRQHLETAAASSAGQYNLNSKTLASLPVPLPSLEEQRALLSEMSTARTLIESLTSELATAKRRAGALRASLLAEAFAGRLVSQDPSDEPASELLARIRAERQAALPKQKARSPRTRKDLAAPPTRVTGDDYQQETLPL
ncbi:restriction endonuclease subunit S [Micromonospora sp. DT62]|uniref:restriction endonuclease subunit S n=1 Tax=Micromonospora sp. DT62 TaxID=3416521 RepID=UPI003CF89D03